MGKTLIIAEKPSAARAIAEALGGFQAHKGYLQSEQYLLSWAIGHLVGLADAQVYNPAYRRWSLAQLPIVPTTFALQVAPPTRAQFELLQRLAAKATALINACDAGREGELIFRYIYSLLGVTKPIQRLWISSLTPEAVRAGFAALQPGEAYENLFRSAQCRSQGDWLVGINATRAFTVRFDELLSIGRVQTPTLALLVKRQAEIDAFVPDDYWEVSATFDPLGPAAGQTYQGRWFTPKTERLPTAEAAAAVAARVRRAGRGRVEAVQEKPVQEPPPRLFDLTELQREANRRFGLTAAATLKAAQQLYEQKLITYPRTDSRYLSKDVARTLAAPLKALARLPAYRDLAAGADLSLIWQGRVVNDARVTDHHAIIPTGQSIPALAGAPARIFDLLARRFLAQLYPPARYLETEVITTVASAEAGDRFRTRGRRVLESGWRVAEPPLAERATEAGDTKSGRRRKQATADDEAARPLPPLAPDQEVTVPEVAPVAKQTRPPRPYTEATLLGAMETAGRQIEDEELREAMRHRGLGTPATRAAIIERLKQVGYIQQEKKHLSPTDKGRRLVAQVEALGIEVLLSPELTGEWEKRIAEVAGGRYAAQQLMAEMIGLTATIVAQVRQGQAVAPPAAAAPAAAPAAGPCPRCGAAVTKQGRVWTCATGPCGFKLPGYLCGKVLPPESISDLLQHGKTGLISDFRSRAGKPFAAVLHLQDGELRFEFPRPRPAGRAAPKGHKRRRG